MRATYRSLFLSLCFSLLISIGSGTAARAYDASSTPVVVPNPVSISLEIETQTNTLFSNTLTVSACNDIPEASSTLSVNAKCAVEQSGIASDWSWNSAYNTFFLNSIGGVGNDYVNNNYWGWFSNLNYGQTGLSNHALTSGEYLLITLGRNPMKITVSSTSPMVGATTTVSVSESDLDSGWNQVWLPAASSTVSGFGTALTTDSNGNVDFVPTSVAELSLSATKVGYLPAATIVVSPYENVVAVATSTPVATEPETTTPSTQSSGGCGGSNSYLSMARVDMSSAINYLLSNQNADGSFSSLMLTDWAAIAFASAHQHTDTVATYLRSSTPVFSSVTDYERHAMALEALGINPYSGTSVNVIAPIVSALHDGYFGDSNLINDDIFSILPLMKAGYSQNSATVSAIVGYILHAQQSDGSWHGSADMTSATVQVLGVVQTLPDVSSALSRAQQYLVTAQHQDGGFGNEFSTSWAMQAFSALKQSSSAMVVGGNTPQSYLGKAQQADGGIGALSSATSTRVWSTAYAVPALAGASWGDILLSFAQPEIINSSVVGGAVASSSSPLLVKDFASTTVLFEPTDATTTASATAPTTVVVYTASATSTVPTKSTATKSVPHRIIVKTTSYKMPTVATVVVPEKHSLFGNVTTFFASLWDKIVGHKTQVAAVASSDSNRAITVTLSIYGLYTNAPITIQEGSTMLDALTVQSARDPHMQLLTKNYQGLGAMVESIGDNKNGVGGKYWQYKINGIMPQIGASSYVLKDGDMVEWIFTRPTL